MMRFTAVRAAALLANRSTGTNIGRLAARTARQSTWAPKPTAVSRLRPAQSRRQFCDKPAEAPKPTEGAQNNLPVAVKVVRGAKTATRTTMWVGIAGVAVASSYLIIRELFPSRMSPNAVFNDAFAVVKGNADVTARCGTPLSGYGRDHGGHREGRRNFVENEELTDAAGKKSLRIKFNVEGPRGKGIIYAEVEESMTRGEFVYIIFECARTREAFALVDNRKEISREQMEVQLARALTANGAVLYGTDSCSWTNRQKMEFGDAFNHIKYVECDRNPGACQNIRGYPTWQVGGQVYPGFKKLEDLRDTLAQSQQAK